MGPWRLDAPSEGAPQKATAHMVKTKTR